MAGHWEPDCPYCNGWICVVRMEGSVGEDDTDFVCSRCQRPFYYLKDSGVYFNELGKQIDSVSDHRNSGTMQLPLPSQLRCEDSTATPAVPTLGALKELFNDES